MVTILWYGHDARRMNAPITHHLDARFVSPFAHILPHGASLHIHKGSLDAATGARIQVGECECARVRARSCVFRMHACLCA